MKNIYFSLLGLAVLCSAKYASASAYFELPAADVTQVKSDFTTAGAVVIGIVLMFFAYKMIRALASGRSPR